VVLADATQHWLSWNDACAANESEFIRDMSARTSEMLRIDEGRTLTFCRVVGRRS